MLSTFSHVTSCQIAPMCPGLVRDGDHPPRGFYTEAQGSVPLMVVAKNPGPPFGSEIGIYRGMSPGEIAERHLQFAHDVFYGNLPELEGRRRIFHNRMKLYLRYLLGIDDVPLPYGDYPPAGIWRQCVYTNLVMCGFHGSSNQRLPLEAMEACFEACFTKQMQFFKPKVLLALDKQDVFRFLNRPEIKQRHGLTVLHIKHPSYPIGERRDVVLLSIREQIEKALSDGSPTSAPSTMGRPAAEPIAPPRETASGKRMSSRRDPGRRAPIMEINEALNLGIEEAKEAFRAQLWSKYGYIFLQSEPLVRQTIIAIFNALVEETTDFQVFHGPRRQRGDSWHHPTYAISFNTSSSRHFCDFKPKVVRGGYFKMTLPLPRSGFFSALLRGIESSQRDQSSGSYVDARIYSDISAEQCRQLALAADCVRRNYT